MSEALTAEEVQRLVEENARLQAQLASRDDAKKGRFRRAVAAVMAFLTALLLVLGVVSSWTTNTALDTDKFVARVGPIIDEPQVRTAISTELSAQLISVLDLQDRLKPVLPDNIAFIAAPLASAVENVVRKQVTAVVETEAFRKVWYGALTLSQETVVKTLTGSPDNVQIVNGMVVVDLIGVVRLVLDQLVAQLPTVFGQTLAIPDNLPVDQIRSLVSTYLGVDLPADFAQLPVMDASALQAARSGVNVVNGTVVLIGVLALLMFVLAMVVAPSRRRTLLQIGLWTALITALVFFVVRGVTQTTLAGIADPVLQPAAVVAVREIFSSLRGFAMVLLWGGAILALVMYLVGPGRGPRALRGGVGRGSRWTVDHARTVAEDEGNAAWVARNLDALRLGGAAVAVAVLLFLASWTALVVVSVLLVLYEVGVTLWATNARASNPDAGLGDDHLPATTG